ncbi:hypothetical protein B484DRAFT_398211 [Ochromonadaceae sp. CCMP2298]|nr:hypothetical protein B484DRAFT_398211 [Ochromonadaceae sp. CCMP2298]
MASSHCLVGYIEPDALEILCEADSRFYRVLSRNYAMVLLQRVRASVPLLMDMDDWSNALLSTKVFLKGYTTGQTIYTKGGASNYAYIVLQGSVKEVAEIQASALIPQGLDVSRTLNWGTMFGEISLVNDAPYFNTTTALEPTVVLEHEVAVESLDFYQAVDKFDAMCYQVLRQYRKAVAAKNMADAAEAVARARRAGLHKGGRKGDISGISGLPDKDNSISASNHSVSTSMSQQSASNKSNGSSKSGHSEHFASHHRYAACITHTALPPPTLV